MGGSPGSSARCIQCRQRRRKCDLRAPCKQCLNAGTECGGPSETTVFVHLNAKIIQKHSPRDNLHAAFAKRVRVKKHVHSDSIQRPGSNECLGAVTVPLTWMETSDRLINTVSIRMLYTSIADEFNPTLKVGIFSGDRLRQGGFLYSSIATCIRGLIGYASVSNRSLSSGLFTVLTRYFGAFRDDQKLVDLARSSYTMVLGDFHKHINSMEHTLHFCSDTNHIARALLCLCLALLLFEMVDQPKSKKACEIHADGASKLLQIAGPAILQDNQSLQYIFSGLRGILIPIAVRRRRATFLANEDWLNLPFTIIGKNKQAQLHDLAIRLSTLLERTDSIEESQDPFCLTTGSAIALKLDYLALRQDFVDWFNHVIIDDYGPIYWYTSDQPNIKSEEDPICVPNLTAGTSKVSFRDGPRAGLLTHYWGYQLELIMGLLDLYKTELGDHSQLLDLVPGFDVGACLCEADHLAHLILEAVPYLSSCLEGRITMQSPHDTLARYRNRVGMT